MRILFGVLMCVATAGCTTRVSNEAANVRQMPQSAAAACQFIETVPSENGPGVRVGRSPQSAINKLSNQVARVGGNAFVLQIGNSNSAYVGIRADAYRC